MERLIILCVSILLAGSALAAEYHIDSTGGDDNNPGTVQLPWKTLERINKGSFSPGDRILLKRGGEWREQIIVPSSGTRESPIVFGAYGEGQAPKIVGSDRVTGWAEHSPGIWKAVSAKPGWVWFIDDKIRWGMKRSSISGLKDEGDFLWQDGLLYIKASDPAAYSAIEASIREWGLGYGYGTRHYITVEDLEFMFQYHRGIVMARRAEEQSIGWVIERNVIHHIGDIVAEEGDGIAYYCWNATIRNNTIYEIGNHGIFIFSYVSPLKDNIVEYNTVYDCYHTNIDIMAEGPHNNTHVRYNKVFHTDSFSKAGLNGRSPTSNGIYTSKGVKNVFIYGNIVFKPLGAGIHLGHNSHDIFVYDNSVFRTRDAWASPLYSTTDYQASFRNNAVQDDGPGIKIFGPLENKIVDHNCYGTGSEIAYAGKPYNDIGTYRKETGYDANSVWADPMFEYAPASHSGIDLRLKPGSPCIDKGTATSYSRDYDGIPVPQGETHDMGAFEFIHDGCARAHDADDSPCDGCVSVSELAAFLDSWRKGSEAMRDLFSAIGLWKAGCPA